MNTSKLKLNENIFGYLYIYINIVDLYPYHKQILCLVRSWINSCNLFKIMSCYVMLVKKSILLT